MADVNKLLYHGGMTWTSKVKYLFKPQPPAAKKPADSRSAFVKYPDLMHAPQMPVEIQERISVAVMQYIDCDKHTDYKNIAAMKDGRSKDEMLRRMMTHHAELGYALALHRVAMPEDDSQVASVGSRKQLAAARELLVEMYATNAIDYAFDGRKPPANKPALFEEAREEFRALVEGPLTEAMVHELKSRKLVPAQMRFGGLGL